MSKEFDLLVFIGRFQPFHNEHKRILDIALQKSKNVLILVGSAGKARTIRNPFTFQERKDMIEGAFGGYQQHIIINPLYDKTYNDTAWVKQVQDVVHDTVLDIINGGQNAFRIHGVNDAKVGLIGASKDNTSYYLKMFPQFRSVNVDIQADVHATAIREDYLDTGRISDACPKSVFDFLMNFRKMDAYEQLARELNFVHEYKKQWEAAPYPVKHSTVDVVVEQSGHVLLVKRRSEPGKGLWALPGGHLNEYEKQLDGAIRELREETKIKVPEAVLRGSIHNQHTFDDPYRSTLGRVITQAYHIKLADDTTLPKVKGSDDAEKARWVPISELHEEDFFDDHYFIIQYFLGL
jgi:bifunctional NMN adenylyltransferase/nudix hydrolase